MQGTLRIFAVLTGLLFPINPGLANPDLVREFAFCTGKLSAELEHSWLLGNSQTRNIKGMRDAMEQLLEAVTSPDQRTQAMAYRVNAKFAHKRLLARATFNQRPEDAVWALSRAKAQISSCAQFILS